VFGGKLFPSRRLGGFIPVLVYSPTNTISPAFGWLLLSHKRPCAAVAFIAICKPVEPRNYVVSAVAWDFRLYCCPIRRRCLNRLPFHRFLQVVVSKLVNSLKGASSRKMKRYHPELSKPAYLKDALWSPSYFAGSVGGAPLSLLKQYIEQQTRPN
jgi:Transposase and inactivated derivatives